MHAVEILTLVGNALSGAQRLHEPTACTPPNGTINGEIHLTEALPAGQYACYTPVEYAWCEAHADLHEHRASSAPTSSPAPATSPSTDGNSTESALEEIISGLEGGAVVAIAVGCTFVGLLCGMAAGLCIGCMAGKGASAASTSTKAEENAYPAAVASAAEEKA